MAKVKFDASKLIKKIQVESKQFVTDERTLNDFGERLVINNKAEAIDGKNSRGESFPTLSPEWVKRKERLATANRGSISRFYRQGRSNVNFFGELVNGIFYKIASGKLFLGIEGKHSPVIGVRGRKLQGSDSNLSDIYDGLKNIDDKYDFLGVSENSKEYLKVLFIRFLRRRKIID